jgi:2-methylcitrate dehydratase PrpD
VIPVASSYTLIERLAKHLQRPLDPHTRERARLHLLDWLACVAGARQTPVAAVLRKADLDLVRRTGWLGGLLEMDDVHRSALLHPGPVVWPVVLAAAGEDDNICLTRVLDGAVRGYEAMIAVGATFDARHYAHYHNTATAGPFGAAAAAGSVLELDEAQLIAALSNAGSTTGGLWQMRHEPGMTKPWHLAVAGNNGCFAAHMARAGLSGTPSLLEGPQGLYAATCDSPAPLELGQGWRIHEVSFKPWAACRHAHPAIDCVLELRAQGRLTAPFHVETYRDAIVFCDRPDPQNEGEAKFSLQHAVAVAAAGLDARPEDFTPAAIAELAALRAQVSVAEAPDITARYPAHFGARVNGFELADTRGDPERPVDAEMVREKMAMLAHWGRLGTGEAERAAALALHGYDAGALIAMLREWLR